jgi:hypothetical protein
MRPSLLLGLATLGIIRTLAHETDHPDGIEVGFDLQPTYATIAISYPNGTLAEIGRVDGGEEYRKLMEKFSDSDNEHPA